MSKAELIWTLASNDEFDIEDGNNNLVAVVSQGRVGKEQGRINRDLIAAAPDLLSACKSFRDAVGDKQKHASVLQILAAIAKTEGAE